MLRDHAVDLSQVSRRQLDVATRKVLQGTLLFPVQARVSVLPERERVKCDVRGARERDNMGAERADPGDAQLARGVALLRRNGLQRVDEREVVLDVFLAEAREHPAGVVCGQVVDGLDLSSQEATAEGSA